jgi:rhomboid protease GluP
MWGFTRTLHALAREDLGLVPLVLGACGLLYVLTLAADLGGVGGGSLLGLLSPSPWSLLRFGAGGALPTFGLERFWTVLSAGWLHGGVLHIVFNMMAVRDLVPLTAHLYGPGRTAIIYVLSSAAGFVVSSAVAYYLPFLPWPLRGAQLTVGASGAVFGLVGAIFHYGRRGGSRLLRVHARGWALGGLLFGVLVPFIDNWAHLGGLAGGWALGRLLDPLRPERGDHVAAGLGLLVLCAVAVAVSLLVPLPLRRG